MTRSKNVVEVRKPGFYQDTDGDYWLKTHLAVFRHDVGRQIPLRHDIQRIGGS